jgi:thymidylate kinase
MRIAFSGTHRVGKTTLLERVAELLPSHATIDEPYYLLEEEGYQVAHEPSLDDFSAQLERSLASLADDAEHVLYDRCPADVLAYLLTHADADEFEPEEWLDRVRDAMATLDLVVFVPLEEPDRVAVRAGERRWRTAVHEQLEAMLVDDTYDFGVDVVRVEGDVRSRTEQVMETVRARELLGAR